MKTSFSRKSGLVFIWTTLAIELMAGGAAAAPPGGEDAQRFRIHVHEDGVYRVDFEELLAAGLTGPVASTSLALENLGHAVPIRVDDNGDGRFEPGDGMVFVGQHLRGEKSHYHDYSPFNVYVLTIKPASGAEPEIEALRMVESAAPSLLDVPAAASLNSELHLERDSLRLPISGRTGRYEETLWYWMQMNHLASLPTRIPVDLSRLDRSSESLFSLRLRFRGGSDSASAAALPLPDHVVDISLNGSPIGRASWRGRETHSIEIPEVSKTLVKPEGNEIEIRVLSRRHAENEDPIIDVVYLDWIEAAFPRDSKLDERQARIGLSSPDRPARLSLSGEQPGGPAPERIDLFGSGGFAMTIRAAAKTEPGTGSEETFEALIPAGQEILWVVPNGQFRRSTAIELDHPSALAESTIQRDYFMITHPSLAEAIAPLARFHEGRGTRTEIVNVQDIYDEFNYGIKHPQAIRDFLAHARTHRAAPAPSLVLLVGDANWYTKEHHDVGAEGNRLSELDLIPTWYLRSRDGPAASDNPFVMLNDDGLTPDMAIGRFPAANPDELRSMVAKTVAYMDAPPSGPWRARVMLASDPTRNLSARNTPLARKAGDAGFDAVELLADAEADGEKHQARLRSSLDEGMLLLHFFGHGGRFMWQTAASQGNAGNLFDLDDLDLLAPSSRLPIVLSMSCNTGPFDHPSADSLAEKFLRIPGRGAVAVLAASARNSPSMKFTSDLFDGILHDGTLGDAIRKAKDDRLHADAVLLYNLLGDPALVPARPSAKAP